MKKILFLSLFLILSVFIYSCSDSGGDDGPGVPSGGGTGGEVVNPDPGGQIPDDGSQTPGDGSQTLGGTQTGFPASGDPSCPDDASICGNGYNCYDYAVWPTGMDDVIVRPDNHSDSNLLAVDSKIYSNGAKYNDIYFKNFTYNEFKTYVRKFVSMGYNVPAYGMDASMIEEMLSHSEDSKDVHQFDLSKSSTTSLSDGNARYTIIITYYTDESTKYYCGVKKGRVRITQAHNMEY